MQEISGGSFENYLGAMDYEGNMLFSKKVFTVNTNGNLKIFIDNKTAYYSKSFIDPFNYILYFYLVDINSNQIFKTISL